MPDIVSDVCVIVSFVSEPSLKMKLCLCVLYTALQVTVGCIISESKYETITRSPGESVLLSCSCTDLQTKPGEIQWTGPGENKDSYKLIGDLNPEEKRWYSGRVQTFSDSPPGNMSLLLSDLTEEDQGEYTCEIESNKTGRFRVITLIIKREGAGEGCIISEHEGETITRSPGESVLLSCSCTDLQTKPDEIQWDVITGKEFYKLTGDLNLEEKKRYSGRVQTFSDSSPGNASLLLSDLTEEDQGEYACGTTNKGIGKIRTIKLIITRGAGKGCLLSEPANETITRSPGESVLLSCSCTDLQTTPDEIQWEAVIKEEHYKLTGELNKDEKKRYSGRVQTFSNSSPGNLSLLLSNVIEEDGGEYMCQIENRRSRTITLIVKGAESGFGLSSTVLMILILLVGVLGTAAVLYWRYTKRRNEPSDSRGEQPGQEQQRDEDVTYSTVDHGNRTRPPPKEINTEENTEYSSIRLDRV
ncbi:V-set and immunoglobulin domain-containing protein 1-like isoform X2 [Sardina pilchardus]|uniref:V-set and immunoglobulin domain-containing protein 1-like isoform X2 n=1 Tax=Sardina pilchardus TaxID=27697 RepID=UPI002E0F77AC